MFSAIFLFTGTFSYSNKEETGPLNVTWLDEGVRIYDAITKKMNPEILPTDDYYYNKIKHHHLYFVKQLHEGEEKANTFYQVRIIYTRLVSYTPGKYHIYQARIIYTRQGSYRPGKYHIYQAGIIYTRLV